MSYFDKFINSVFRKNIADYPPFQVVEVNPVDYARYQVLGREDPIICYSNGTADVNELYEILVLKDLQSKAAYSLIRCKVRSEVENYFHSLSQVLPHIFMICPSLTIDLLQDISNYVREHPNQSLPHVCAYFGLIDYFKQLSASDVELINIQDPDSGLTPLHLAIKTCRLSSVQAVLALSPKLEIVDKENNNALHFSASTNKDIINKLCLSLQTNSNGVRILETLINSRNKDNFSPLYLACLNDKSECTIELLKNGADPNGASISEYESFNEVRKLHEKNFFDQLETKDMKNGGTPLHWSHTPQCMEPLIEQGCNIDARNFQGETALHLMVSRNKLACVITLLSYGADANAKGPNGNTPLHLAVKTGQVSLVQALVVFGADVNLQNSSGETPRHLAAPAKRSPQTDLILYILHSVGAKRCVTNRSNCTDGCSQSTGSHFNGIPPENSPFKRSAKLYCPLMGESLVKEALGRKRHQQMAVDFDGQPNKKCKVLSLDGGGVRGLILIQMLWVMEEMMSKRMYECFDWMSGTSTGGILALLLAMGHTAHECRQLYFKLKDKVFVGNRPYESEPLEKFLQKSLGEESLMSDIKKPKIMITATVADRFPPDLQLFRNYESSHDILTEVGIVTHDEPISDMPKPQEQLVWKTARSSGAAPTYFRPMDSFLDGGMISNNPTLDTLTEIHKINQALKVVNRESEQIEVDVVVSLGTGAIPVNKVPIIDIYKPSMSNIMGVAKMALQTPALFQLLIEQACQADGQVVERAKAWCSQINVPFFRLNPPLSEDIPLNETDNVKLVNMLWETTAYMHSRTSEVQELISLLFD